MLKWTRQLPWSSLPKSSRMGPSPGTNNLMPTPFPRRYFLKSNKSLPVVAYPVSINNIPWNISLNSNRYSKLKIKSNYNCYIFVRVHELSAMDVYICNCDIFAHIGQNYRRHEYKEFVVLKARTSYSQLNTGFNLLISIKWISE